MKLRRKFGKFLAMRDADRLLLFEAIVMLGLARFIVFAFPFSFIVPWLSRTPDNGGCDEILLVSIRQAVTMAARNIPWNAVCLPQAMAAKAMLARRGCGSSFHLGADLDTQGKLIAHAWLMAGDQIVVGGAGIAGVTPLTRFG
jgi:hypothetical protein